MAGRGDGAVALSDALVSIGAAGRGGTGSFVSDDGLILTNWHVAYEYIRQASLLEGEDFVRDGYVAKSRKEELRAPNCEVWLTRRVEDVSDAVLDVLDEPDPLKRATALRDRRQQIASYAENVLRQQAQQLGVSAEGVRCDVQEMFANEKYLLFTYERLRDVRIAYAPPSSLGAFGGDSDNFEWPRHTADFALLRAYADADNAPADYAASNVPYTPSKRLRLNPEGADDGDFAHPIEAAVGGSAEGVASSGSDAATMLCIASGAGAGAGVGGRSGGSGSGSVELAAAARRSGPSSTAVEGREEISGGVAPTARAAASAFGGSLLSRWGISSASLLGLRLLALSSR